MLFSSKNNHAVDVVESRINGLGPYPLLLRLGKEEHHARMAQHLTSGSGGIVERRTTRPRYEWLAARASKQDRARFDAVQREIAAVVSLRNAVDELERAAEPARALFGERVSPRSGRRIRSGAAARLQAFSAALDAARRIRADRHGPPAGRFHEGPPRRARGRDRGRTCAAMPKPWALRCLRPLAEAISIPGRRFANELADRLEWAERVRAYWQALDAACAPPGRWNNLARDLTRIAEESAHNSLELWQCWLRLRPSRWTPEQRKLLSEYVVAAADDRRRRRLRRRRAAGEGFSPLLQPVSEGGEDAARAGR